MQCPAFKKLPVFANMNAQCKFCYRLTPNLRFNECGQSYWPKQNWFPGASVHIYYLEVGIQATEYRFNIKFLRTLMQPFPYHRRQRYKNIFHLKRRKIFNFIPICMGSPWHSDRSSRYIRKHEEKITCLPHQLFLAPGNTETERKILQHEKLAKR